METTLAGSVGASVSASSPTTRSFSDLKSEDFFQLLIAELQSQDPLNPTDNQALLDQMSSIRQMEQLTTLNNTLESLASEQRFGATASLIGQYVTGEVTDSGGNVVAVKGIVTSVQYEKDGGAVLELHNGNILPAEKVTEVTLLENLSQEELERIQTELGLNNPEPDATSPDENDPDLSPTNVPPGTAAAKSKNSKNGSFIIGDPGGAHLDINELLGIPSQPQKVSSDELWKTLLGVG